MQNDRRKILELLLQHSRVQKFVEDYARLDTGPDGRSRTIMSPMAWTGRMRHRGQKDLNGKRVPGYTNHANISGKYRVLDPIYNLRDVLIADDGRLLGYADLSQAEARVAAWMSRDPLAVRQYQEGVDRYRFFASHFYAVPELQIGRAQRNVGKMGVLAYQYGVGWATFQEQVNKDAELTGVSISAAEAKKADALYHRLYPGYKVWHQRVLAGVQKTGHVRNCFGRRIEFFNRVDSASSIDKLKRDAVASLPQSTIADLLNSKLVEVYRAMDPKEIRILLQVHDAILFDCERNGHCSWRGPCRRVLGILDSRLEIEGEECHIPAEVFVGESWGQMREVTEEL
jgi:DNA polymerase I-like protein with 3'-5' exonuclease and polymerase domains